MSVCVYMHMLLAVSKPLAVLIPLQGLEMAWPFQNGHMIPFGRYDTSPV